MKPKPRTDESIERLAVPLWPDAGRSLGIGKNKTYELAQTGVIPVLPHGRPYRVSKEWLRRVTSGEVA